MCRSYAHSVMPLPAGPSQGQPAPVLATRAQQQLSSPGLGAESRMAFTPTTYRARHNPASTFFLTQKTVYISLHFQGYHSKEKCQKVPFLKLKPTLHV